MNNIRKIEQIFCGSNESGITVDKDLYRFDHKNFGGLNNYKFACDLALVLNHFEGVKSFLKVQYDFAYENILTHKDNLKDFVDYVSEEITIRDKESLSEFENYKLRDFNMNLKIFRETFFDLQFTARGHKRNPTKPESKQKNNQL